VILRKKLREKDFSKEVPAGKVKAGIVMYWFVEVNLMPDSYEVD